MAGERLMTTDHDRIRRWAEARNGRPATVKATRSEEDPGLIRLDFPGYSGGDSLEEIPWEEWFRKFDESGLVLLYQETLASGGKSNFNKLISRETAEQNDDAEWADDESGGRGSRGTEREEQPSLARAASGGERSIDLNRATAEELEGVFGVGPVTAEKIIAYRDHELGGRFHNEHDVTHIPGIGEETARMLLKNARIG